ncbi:ras GEF [Rhizophagus clarus]|uniref:Ras GEF n=1 Tax=Rhizophagus clarus TaxID=94130 RepID=A0A8H3MDV0_9GLOM|nr:ras GEF [Rhizophagus clarus]
MDNKTESTNIKETTENIENSGITLENDNNKDTQHENIEEETTDNLQPQESLPNIISDKNTTQQVSESPIISSNLNIPAVSKFASDIVISTSVIGSNVAAHQKSKSRHQLSNSEAFINLDDDVSMRDTMKSNRPRESRRSAPVPYRPTTEFDVQNLPRPNSQIIIPTMRRYNSIITPNSDQEFARILNWPTQSHDHDRLQQSQKNLVGLNSKDNLVDDGEIIFDTTSFNQAGDIQQLSHGQIPSYIPQGRFSVTAAMHQVINPSRAPEVPSLISTYGTEIFNQIQSDDDSRLIVWSISRAEERRQGSIISSYVSSSKRWSIHEKLERAGKTICGAGLRDRFENKLSKNRHSIVMTEKVIMAATIEKLIEKLTSGIDYTFLTDFFLTYRAFITPLHLCKLLILRFNWALEADDEKRRVVRVRTFVTLRHWLLNYFAYDFVPCRDLRSTLITYLNTLHPLAPRDQKIVQALKRIIKRLKKIYYRKGVVGISKNGNGGNITEKKTGDIIPENTQRNSEQFLEDDGISLSSKEKSKRTVKHESTSTISSILTPGTTDSESEEFGRHRSSRSGISRPTEFEVVSSNSQYSDEFSTDENPISSFYDEKLAKSLPALTNKNFGDWDLDVDDKDNDKIPIPKQDNKKKLKLRSSSMSDLSQRRKLQAEFSPLKHNLRDNLKDNLKDNDIIMEEEEPPPLPPRRRRRHTITYTQPSLVVPPSPSFFKGGFLNFPIRKPKKAASQETMNEKFQDRTRKKRSLSLSEAICGFAENDDDEDENDEFDLSQIDHAGGIVRRNSSPAYIGSTSIQKEKGETPKRKTGRPSWPQKVSATVGKFARVLFTPSGTGKSGGIKILCANSDVVTSEERDSETSVPHENLNEDDLPIYLDGFSYVDESLEEEYYDARRQEDFAGTEERFNWDDEEEGELQEEIEEEEEETDDEGLASTSIEPHIPPIHEQEKEDKNEYLEEQENSHQNTKTIRRKPKVWELNTVIEVVDDDNLDRSSISLHDILESKKEEEKITEELSSENKQTEEPQSVRRNRRIGKIYEVKDDEPTIFVTPPESSENKGEVLEQGLDIDEEDDENNSTSRRLRRLPKVRDLRSAVTIKDLEEKSESVKSSSDIGTEIQGEKEASKEVGRELVKRKDKSIMKPPSSEPITNNNDIPVQHTTTTTTTATTTAESRGSIKIPNKNIPSTTQKSSLNKPLPPLPIQDNQPKRPPSISTTINSQSRYRSFILNYRSEDIAKQFCLIERDFLLKVNWEDLVQVGYTTNDENVKEKKEKRRDAKGKGKELEEVKEKPRKRVRENGVDKVIERFNLACDWVATEIVLTRSLDDRVQVIEKFIRIAQKCLQFSNFATLTQILLGLQSPPVERLRRTWTRVRNEDLHAFKELSEYISAFGNWKVIREAMRKSIEDSTILKELMKQRKSRISDVRNTGCIPFLGLYLSDLVFNAAVPSFIDPTSSQPSTPSSPLPSSSADATSPLHHQPLINFHKHRTTATIVKRVLTFQTLSRGYNFSIDKEIYDKCYGLKGFEATKLVVMDLDVDDFV